MIRTVRVGIAVAALSFAAACGPQTSATRTYDVGALPGTNLELGWWAAVTTVEQPPTVPNQPRTAEVDVPADILFTEGSSDLSEDSDSALSKIISEIKAKSGRDITVVGHTDHLGDDRFNEVLGHQRAQAVVDALQNRGIAPETITPPRSAGETEPLCDETKPDGTDNPDCRARDRRVVITYRYTTAES